MSQMNNNTTAKDLDPIQAVGNSGNTVTFTLTG